MKILSNKTYNNLLLKISKLESDLKKQIDKADSIQIEHNCTILELEQSKEKCKKLRNEIIDNTAFISHLNDRVIVAEYESDKKIERILELESRLCRKGTGTKGSKKVDNVFSCDTETIDPNDDLASTEPQYINITSEEQLRNYIGKKFECTLKCDESEEKISGEVLLKKNMICILCFNNSLVGWTILDEDNLNTNYKNGWGVFNHDFNKKIFNLRIIL